MKTKAKNLFREAVDEAIPALEAALSVEGVAVRHPRPIVQAVVRAYLVVAQDLDAKRMDYRISPVSRALAEMPVGGWREFPGATQQDVRQRMPTARDLMSNPGARWRCETRGAATWCLRVEDNARPHRDPWKNPKVREIAAMKVGETILSKTVTGIHGAGTLGSNSKVAARKAMREPGAQWTCKAAGPGKVRITRVK